MRKAFAVAAIAAALALPHPALADETAKVLPLQVADAVTTRILLRRPCAFERDPLARGAMRSDLGAIASAVVMNALLRAVTRRHPAALRIVAGAESAAVANNLRDIAKAPSNCY